MLQVEVERQETDQALLYYIISDTHSDYVAGIIKQRFDQVIAYKAIDFKSNVAKIISECQSKHGIPMFRTSYAGQPFPNNSALMVCYASHNGRMKGVWFKNIPDEDLRILASKTDGYIHMQRKYSSLGDGMNYQIRDKYENYGRNGVCTANNSISHQERLEALLELKAEIEKAIPDEQDAQRMYEKMTALARKAGVDDKAIEIDLIRGQENNHENIFRDMGRDVDRKIERESAAETNAPCPTTARPISGQPISGRSIYSGTYVRQHAPYSNQPSRRY